MKRQILACLIAALAMPVAAHAEDAKPSVQAGCPGAQMTELQKQMRGMMGDVGGMMQRSKDPAMKKQLSQMRDHMALMMTSMQQMGGGMMGNGMMGGRNNGMMGGGMGRGMMGGGMMQQAPSGKPPAAPEAKDSKP